MRLLLFAAWAGKALYVQCSTEKSPLLQTEQLLFSISLEITKIVALSCTHAACSCDDFVFSLLISIDCCNYVTLQSRGAELLHPPPRQNGQISGGRAEEPQPELHHHPSDDQPRPLTAA